MAKRGRPRLYDSVSEKMKAYRESKKQGGAVLLNCYLPTEYKELLYKFCQESNLTLGDAICYLLDLHYPDSPDEGE